MNVSSFFRKWLPRLLVVAGTCIPAMSPAAPPTKTAPIQQAVMAAPSKGAASAGASDLAGKPQIPCDLDRLAENLKATYDNQCTGYEIAIFHDGKLFKELHGGLARTSLDSPARNMSASDRLEIGSVSKTMNAICTLKVLASKGKTVDESIAAYLPKGWAKHATISGLKFRHLLSHTSGLEEFSVIDPQDYTPGKVNQGVKNVLAKGVVHPQTYNYNNMNYELLRVLVPYLVDPASMKAAEGDEKEHEKALADCFTNLVRQNVFEPAGIGTKVYLKDWHPSGNDYDLARYYNFGKPKEAGVAGEDRSLRPGRGGWKMTAQQVAQVIAALEAGYLLPAGQVQAMKEGKLGIFSGTSELGTFYGHNGKSHGGDKGGRAQYLAFPNNIQVALLINSFDNACGSEHSDLIRDAWLDACKFPDLVVTSFNATGSAKFEDGKLTIPFSMTVKNQGSGATKNNLVNAVRYNQDFHWSGIMDPLAAGASKNVNGTVSIPDPQKGLAGKTIKLVAFCDAPIAAADTSMPAYGRVKESNEPNNLLKSIDVQAPAAIGSITTEGSGKGSPQLAGKSAGDAKNAGGSKVGLGKSKSPPRRLALPK